MIKNKVGVLIAGVVVLGVFIYLGINWRKESISLNQQLEMLKEEVEILNEKEVSLVEEKDRLNKEKLELQKKLEELKEEYYKLNTMYQKELEPVSFSSNNLLIASNATKNKLDKVLDGTGLEGLSQYYLEAEEIYSINSIFLVALTAEESGWGNSNRAKTQNNLSGYAVYSPSARGVTFNSKGESIMATAELLSRDYLNSNGKYYNGLSADSVNIRYCPDDDKKWSKNITQIANEIVHKINSQ